MSRFHRVDLSAALAETVLERHAETLLSDQDYRLQVRIGRFSKTAITALGIRDLDVITSVAILVKVMEKHGLKPSIVESLKDLILEPVAVYKSATERESIVVVTAEMPDGINPLLIPIKIDVMGASGKSNFHWMASAYAKEKPEIIERWEKNGLLLWKPSQAVGVVAVVAATAEPTREVAIEVVSIDQVVVLDTEATRENAKGRDAA